MRAAEESYTMLLIFSRWTPKMLRWRMNINYRTFTIIRSSMITKHNANQYILKWTCDMIEIAHTILCDPYVPSSIDLMVCYSVSGPAHKIDIFMKRSIKISSTSWRLWTVMACISKPDPMCNPFMSGVKHKMHELFLIVHDKDYANSLLDRASKV